MSKKTTIQFWSVLSVNIALMFSSSAVLATPLMDLLSGDEIIVGDKRFYDFRDFVSTATGSVPDPADAARIEVDPIFAGDEFGLRFSSATWVASSRDGFFGPGGSQTTEFRYDVEVLGSQSIIGNSLSYETSILNIGGESLVSEIVTSLPSLGVIANTEVRTFQFDFIFSQQLEDQDTFAPQTQISIQNRIYVEDPGTSISEFSQTFRQVSVPEPGTLFLLGTGLVALASRARRRR